MAFNTVVQDLRQEMMTSNTVVQDRRQRHSQQSSQHQQQPQGQQPAPAIVPFVNYEETYARLKEMTALILQQKKQVWPGLELDLATLMALHEMESLRQSLESLGCVKRKRQTWERYRN